MWSILFGTDVLEGRQARAAAFKRGTVRRRVEEVLWRTRLEDFETSMTLEKLDETSNDKKEWKGRDTRKSRRRYNDCCDLSTVNRFRRTCWDERKWSTIWWAYYALPHRFSCGL